MDNFAKKSHHLDWHTILRCKWSGGRLQNPSKYRVMAFFCNKISCKKTLLGDDTTPYTVPQTTQKVSFKSSGINKKIIGIPCIFSSFFSRTSLWFFVFFSVLFVGALGLRAPRNATRSTTPRWSCIRLFVFSSVFLQAAPTTSPVHHAP